MAFAYFLRPYRHVRSVEGRVGQQLKMHHMASRTRLELSRIASEVRSLCTRYPQFDLAMRKSTDEFELLVAQFEREEETRLTMERQIVVDWLREGYFEEPPSYANQGGLFTLEIENVKLPRHLLSCVDPCARRKLAPSDAKIFAMATLHALSGFVAVNPPQCSDLMTQSDLIATTLHFTGHYPKSMQFLPDPITLEASELDRFGVEQQRTISLYRLSHVVQEDWDAAVDAVTAQQLLFRIRNWLRELRQAEATSHRREPAGPVYRPHDRDELILQEFANASPKYLRHCDLLAMTKMPGAHLLSDRLAHLSEIGLIEPRTANGRSGYRITSKGRAILETLRGVKESKRALSAP